MIRSGSSPTIQGVVASSASRTSEIRGLPGTSPMPVIPSSVWTSTIALVRPQSRPKRHVSGFVNGTETTWISTFVTFMALRSYV